jgi:acyl carrier protein
MSAVDLVLKVLRSVLGEDTGLTSATSLFDVPGFDSLALAALVEGLEDALGLTLPDELIVPESFATPAGIAANLIEPVLRGHHEEVPS